MSNTDKIVLPGGAGLVGQNLVAHLKRQGYTQIVVIDKHHANLNTLRSLHPDITAIEADLAEGGAWEAQLEGTTAVVMLQAQIGGLDPEKFVRNNITSTERVLDAMRKHHVQYVVHISSSVVMSVADDHYTSTKRQQEIIVTGSGIPTAVLRPTLMFGWFDRKHLGWLSRFMQKTPLFPVPGHGRYMRQPLFAQDLCHVIARCIETRNTGTFNITGQEKVDYIDIVREIKRASGAKCAIVRLPYPVFYLLLKVYGLISANPPFTADQLKALVAGDEFEVSNWPERFGVNFTPFADAMRATFNDPHYSSVVLEF